LPFVWEQARLFIVSRQRKIMAKNHTVLAWASVGAYALLIFILSAMPGGVVPRLFCGADKILHFVEYLPLGVLLMRAMAMMGSRRRIQALLVTLFVVMLYALTDEIHQVFVPGRTLDAADWAMDVLGAVAGGGLYSWPK